MLFFETWIDLGLKTDPDTLVVLSRVISMGYSVVYANFEMKGREEAAITS